MHRLIFIEKSGRNRTPDKLPALERQSLFTACDDALNAMITILGARGVIGIGNFAKNRAAAALTKQQLMITSVPHPSPANPAANYNWAKLMDNCLLDLKF
ncbi:hypothetical protein CCP3SC5AM1_2540004 [Gammaproteobacteria bacterium]